MGNEMEAWITKVCTGIKGFEKLGTHVGKHLEQGL